MNITRIKKKHLLWLVEGQRLGKSDHQYFGKHFRIKFSPLDTFALKESGQ